VPERVGEAVEVLEYWAARLLRDFEAIPAADRMRAFPQAGTSAALQALTPEALRERRQVPWGGSMSLGEYIFRPSYHLAYHDGQLNYIQRLLGDREFHFG